MKDLSNYTDYSTEENMYAMHTPTRAIDVERLKYFEEIFPVDGEENESWVRRTAVHIHKLTEYAYHHHIYGTKRKWACHESSRYCFICTLCNIIEVIRNMSMDMIELYPDEHLRWKLSNDAKTGTQYRLIKPTLT